jgi:hypothetical protein
LKLICSTRQKTGTSKLQTNRPINLSFSFDSGGIPERVFNTDVPSDH